MSNFTKTDENPYTIEKKKMKIDLCIVSVAAVSVRMPPSNCTRKYFIFPYHFFPTPIVHFRFIDSNKLHKSIQRTPLLSIIIITMYDMYAKFHWLETISISGVLVNRKWKANKIRNKKKKKIGTKKPEKIMQTYGWTTTFQIHSIPPRNRTTFAWVRKKAANNIVPPFFFFFFFVSLQSAVRVCKCIFLLGYFSFFSFSKSAKEKKNRFFPFCCTGIHFNTTSSKQKSKGYETQKTQEKNVKNCWKKKTKIVSSYLTNSASLLVDFVVASIVVGYGVIQYVCDCMGGLNGTHMQTHSKTNREHFALTEWAGRCMLSGRDQTE